MSFENRYSTVDRLLHRLAFSTVPAQIALADLEDRLYKSAIESIDIENPVFVTALPRAGTTLLLELCFNMSEFSSHCYRDMPFVTTPMFWNKFASWFRQSDVPRERAHGDGMLVNVDSPEAFEEILWKAFWRNHYRADRIIPWRTESDPEFDEFFTNHIRKLIAIRNGSSEHTLRYISKNNLNIARVELLLKSFSNSIIVIPYRHPLQHAASLHRQHLNFLEIHANDPFAKDYMSAIGHYDFGENLRPIDFGNWLSRAKSKDTTSLSFWIEYWIAAYKELLSKTGDRVHILSYENFCSNPKSGLDYLAHLVDIKEKDNFLKQDSRIKLAKPHEIDISTIPSEILNEADALHNELNNKSEL